jgi:hypothetical protein
MGNLGPTTVFGDLIINGSIGGAVRIAYCAEAAPADTKLDMYLDNDTTGELVEVNCSIIGGGTLDAALPLLADGDLVPVVNLKGIWYAWNLFHPETPTSSSSSSSSSSSEFNPYAGRLFIDMLATEEEYKLTSEEFIEKKVDEFYESNPNIFDDKTDEEKENIILNLVGEGELFADVAIEIANREGLNID